MIRIVSLLLLLSLPLESFGWWDSGHQLVCDISELHLSDTAKKQVQDLLGGERKFAKGCVWPDTCLLYTSPSPRDVEEARMPSSA